MDDFKKKKKNSIVSSNEFFAPQWYISDLLVTSFRKTLQRNHLVICDELSSFAFEK